VWVLEERKHYWCSDFRSAPRCNHKNLSALHQFSKCLQIPFFRVNLVLKQECRRVYDSIFDEGQYTLNTDIPYHNFDSDVTWCRLGLQ
jgi:hypothetical protein